MNTIECRGITKKFGGFKALDNVTVEVPEGRIFGLLGPNGAGKTTLIRIINNITLPTEGQVIFNGRPITADDVRRIGYLPEERGLYKKLKVCDQVLYFARLKGMSSADATVELKKWFVKFGIESWWNKKIEELSKGMAQKIQFITTIVHKPRLLILDEPFSGFDPVNVQVVRDEILGLRENGTTIMLSTHNMESVEELCDDIVLLNKSKVVVSGGVNEVRRKYGSNQMEICYHGSSAAALPDCEAFTTVLDEEHQGGRRAVLNINDGHTNRDVIEAVNPIVEISSFQELVPRMNDIFIKLVGGK